MQSDPLEEIGSGSPSEPSCCAAHAPKLHKETAINICFKTFFTILYDSRVALIVAAYAADGYLHLRLSGYIKFTPGPQPRYPTPPAIPRATLMLVPN